MKKFLVITTINQPTAAVYKFCEILGDEWKIIIVGDRKGPFEYLSNDKIIFLDIETQYKLYPEFAKLLPEKHYCRKNIGYLHAIKLGADYIAETDDDNIPYDFFPNFIDENEIETNVINKEGSVNIYSYFTEKLIRPRGLELSMLKNSILPEEISIQNIKPYIQQGLADKDPDVDAIYRLVLYENIIFDTNKQIALGSKSWSPFNTQNTYWHKKAFPLLLIPTTVKSRICDIWKGYIAQKGLQSINGNLLFLSPSVYQERNEHDLQLDFNEEVPLYIETRNLINVLDGATLSGDLKKDILTIYNVLIQENILGSEDKDILEEWLKIF